jgi:GMP synthase-like glutamine amidotransferase
MIILIFMLAHFLQHVRFEGFGNIEPWLITNGYDISVTRFFKSPVLPDYHEIDLLVIMGGPMSVNDEGRFPWLVAEKQFIRDCINAGKSVLGICLGSQLIASALGAKVYANREKEIGWFQVEGIEPFDPSLFHLPDSLDVFHWHGDTFDIPAGAVHLARSKACENQAFQLGKKVIGLQFHLETTPESLAEMIRYSRKELVPSDFIQSENQILTYGPEKYRVINDLMGEVLGYLGTVRI